MRKFNLHTHTIYCDGKNTPEELVIEAIERGFYAIGFSGHAYMPFDSQVGMSPQSTRVYKQKIREIKEKYRNKIKIYSGIEQDVFSPDTTEGYDFVIASVHYLKCGDKYVPVDLDRASLSDAADYYGGYSELARNYFELVGNTLEYTKADIIGHFDLFNKLNEKGDIFDEADYLKYACSAMEKLKHIPFEVNTGAMSRGYRTNPYPSLTLLKMLKDMGGRVVYSSDCHSKENIGYAYDDALEYIRAAGFDRFLEIEEIL